MANTGKTIWLILLFCLLWGQTGCQRAPQETPRHRPPQASAMPAGGIYHAWPAAIHLQTVPGATLTYRWQDGPAQTYTAPVRPPSTQGMHLRLEFWTTDAVGQQSLKRREHYVLRPGVPALEVLGIDHTVLGPDTTATLRWRSPATPATYEVALTEHGWGAGRRLAGGAVQPDQEQQTLIPSTALRPGTNRLWLRVYQGNGEMAAISYLLQAHTAPTHTTAWPAGGVFGRLPRIRLITARPASIYYTIDGSTPTTASARYTQPLLLTGSTLLRYMSVDGVGNQETPQQARYTLQPQAPTITLQSLQDSQDGSHEPLVLTWDSDTAGRYTLTLIQDQEQRQVTVQQGRVARQQPVRTSIGHNFLTPGAWQLHLQVQPDSGPRGEALLQLDVPYDEAFASTRYLNPDATTAAWDSAQQRVQLSRGPRLLGTYNTQGRSHHLSVRPPYAYVANGTGGLHIVEVSTPEQPRRAGLFYPHGKATALALYGQYVYLAASASGVMIFDVTAPAAPRLVATVPLRGQASDITIAGTYAYVGTQQGQLFILDLTLPQQPEVVGWLDVASRIVDITVADGIAYLACLNQGIISVDVHTPQQPHLLHHTPTASAATGVAVQAQQLYVAAGALESFTIQPTGGPVPRSRQHLQGAYGVTLQPPYAVVAAGTDGVQIIRMDGRVLLAQQRTGQYAARLVVQDGQAFVADTRGGLQIVDLSQPAQPRLLASLPDIGTIVDVVVDGTLAYLADGQHSGGLVIVDVRTPTAPRVLSQYHNAATTDVVLWQDLALVGDTAGALYVVDVQQPTQPRLRHWLPLPGLPQRLALQPPYVWVAGDTAGVQVVELAPDGTPRLHSTAPVAGRARDIALLGQTAYVAAGMGGVQRFDLRTPSQPVAALAYQQEEGQTGRIIRVLAQPERLYAIDSEHGLLLFTPLPDGALQLVQAWAVPDGAPWGLAAAGPYVFVSTLLNALYVVGVATPTQPRLLSTAPYGGADLLAQDRWLYMAVRGRRGVPGGLRIMEAFASLSSAQVAAGSLPADAVALPDVTTDTVLINRAHIWNSPGVVQSTTFSAADIPIDSATLWVDDFWGPTGYIRYELSPDGGLHWYTVEPGEPQRFPPPGSALQWRATLSATDPAATPLIERLWVDYTIATPPTP